MTPSNNYNDQFEYPSGESVPAATPVYLVNPTNQAFTAPELVIHSETDNQEKSPEEDLIHPSALVSPLARIGKKTTVQAGTQIRERASIGENSYIDRLCFIDQDVLIGSNVFMQNSASICKGTMIESGVFIGSNACFTSYRFPRAIYPGGEVKPEPEMEFECILVSHGATIGAAAVIMPGVRIGAYAMVGAGSVVTADVPAHGMVMGNPARLVGYACRCGQPMHQTADETTWRCSACDFNLINRPPL